jgi:hypothetical protein
MSSVGYFKSISGPTTGLPIGPQLIGGPIQYGPGTYTGTTNTTLTTNQTIGGNIYFGQTANGGTLNLPSAAAIYAACNNNINVQFTLTVFSGFSFTLSGVNWTMYGNACNPTASGNTGVVYQGNSSIVIQPNCVVNFVCVVNGPNDIRAPFSL